MELKQYQKDVIADLSRYLDCLTETKNLSEAYRKFWHDAGVNVGLSRIPAYQNTLPGVPSICAKVPTGGGKTLLACHSIQPIFTRFPPLQARVVVWLVPSDAILTQTLSALRDPSHPYRQALDTDFGSRVEVFTKEQLLSGQNFQFPAITEQLNICVLSYDSFRGRKESLKAKRENSNLAELAKILGKPENPIEDADETALLQVINQLSPLVIVDESHHAKSTLSMEMLRNFNPCFVLELTATPKDTSNIFSYVSAAKLKKEGMVKLPVIVYNRSSQDQVMMEAVALQRRLEEIAEAERETSGRYIRPIALFQAQPRGKDDNTTFQKIKDALIGAGIPAEHIAIRTADINELKNIDLMSEQCSIRYIITVNALKEGWDCPFAYILASVANKSSRVDVEQILGRVLRLPYTRQNRTPPLNMSYVLTSSSDFQAALDNIVLGLNSAGFSEVDCRAASDAEFEAGQTADTAGHTSEYQPEQTTIQEHGNPVEEESGNAGQTVGADSSEEPEDELDLNPQVIAEGLRNTGSAAGVNPITAMLEEAEKTGQAYEQSLGGSEERSPLDNLPPEVRNEMPTYHVHAEFAEEIRTLKIPQFFQFVPGAFYSEGKYVLLEEEMLADGFSLKGKSTEIDFSDTDSEMVMVDVRDKAGNTPKIFKLSEADQQYFREFLSRLPEAKRVEKCKESIYHQLRRLNTVDDGELRRFIGIIVGDMDADQIAGMEKSTAPYAKKIQDKINSLLEEHNEKSFQQGLEAGRIVCQESYSLPSEIHPANSISTIGKSLYAAEEDMNTLERRVVTELTALPNVRWWHRNIARREFRINGFINHYPDILIMTERGTLVVAETKGEHLKNDDSLQKVRLGRAWQKAAGPKYRYYMVFQNTDSKTDGVVSINGFLDILKDL